MGYIIRKSKNTFRVQFERYEAGQRVARKLKAEELMALGLFGRSLEETKKRLTLLNKSEAHKKIRGRRAAISTRLEVAEAIMPAWLRDPFEKLLDQKPNPRHAWVLWRCSLKAINAVAANPEEWTSEAFHAYFEQKGYDPSYVKKLVNMLNFWGSHWQRHTKKLVEKIKQPGLHSRRRLETARQKKRLAPKDSLGIEPRELKALRSELPEDQWQWLFVTFWLGLRPNETRLNPQQPPYLSTEDGVEVAHLWQWKTHCYKQVPLIWPEQKQAFALLLDGRLRKIWPKQLQRRTGRRTHTYAGRKGFAHYCWNEGKDYVEVASWLGHKDISTTYRDYLKWKELKLRKQA